MNPLIFSSNYIDHELSLSPPPSSLLPPHLAKEIDELSHASGYADPLQISTTLTPPGYLEAWTVNPVECLPAKTVDQQEEKDCAIFHQILDRYEGIQTTEKNMLIKEKKNLLNSIKIAFSDFTPEKIPSDVICRIQKVFNHLAAKISNAGTCLHKMRVTYFKKAFKNEQEYWKRHEHLLDGDPQHHRVRPSSKWKRTQKPAELMMQIEDILYESSQILEKTSEKSDLKNEKGYLYTRIKNKLDLIPSEDLNPQFLWKVQGLFNQYAEKISQQTHPKYVSQVTYFKTAFRDVKSWKPYEKYLQEEPKKETRLLLKAEKKWSPY